MLNNCMRDFVAKVRAAVLAEHGQDLVEYALVLALAAIGATLGLATAAKGIDSAFAQIAKSLGTSSTGAATATATAGSASGSTSASTAGSTSGGSGSSAGDSGNAGGAGNGQAYGRNRNN